MLDITEAATEVLHRAHDAAVRFNPDARMRIHYRGDHVEIGLTDEPGDDDETIEHDGLVLFVAPGIEGVLDVSEEHDHLMVRPRSE